VDGPGSGKRFFALPVSSRSVVSNDESRQSSPVRSPFGNSTAWSLFDITAEIQYGASSVSAVALSSRGESWGIRAVIP
jgi:hypothetical protein